ncbi:hypothetical protein D9M70_602260 [compost metagenome]
MKGVEAELSRFCSREFGVPHIEALERAELQRVLVFIEGRGEPQAAREVPPSPASVPAVPTKLPLRQLVITHPLHASTLVALGFIVGKLF